MLGSDACRAIAPWLDSAPIQRLSAAGGAWLLKPAGPASIAVDLQKQAVVCFTRPLLLFYRDWLPLTIDRHNEEKCQ